MNNTPSTSRRLPHSPIALPLERQAESMIDLYLDGLRGQPARRPALQQKRSRTLNRQDAKAAKKYRIK